MENCIKSLLPGGNEVEILIVDDGSTKDNTAEIADRYEKEYPGICKAIHQENGGHGAAVNAGLKAATGIYFKVVDSDDWVNEQAYRQVLDTLRRFVYGKDTLDMLITNFVYEKQGARHKKVMSYKLALPKDELFSWNDVKVFVAGQYILMHSVIYRTELLRDCKLELPEHTFYVDNIFVYEPLPHVHTMYYLNVNFYRYFIGRSDQSVNEQVMIGRIDQQIRVTKLMLGYYDVTKIQNRKLRHYMVRYLEIMMVVCSILAIKSGSEENMEKKKALWEELKKSNPALYLRLRWGFLGQGMNLPGRGGRKISVAAYKLPSPSRDIRSRRSFSDLTKCREMDRDQWKVVLLQPDPGRNKRHPLRKPQDSGRLVCDRGRKPVRKERVVSGVAKKETEGKKIRLNG